MDDYVVTDSISEVTSLDVNLKSISDLSGIESFRNLKFLFCSYEVNILIEESRKIYANHPALMDELNRV